MKKLLAALVIAISICTIANAGSRTLTFAWNQEISADFAGWKLYVSKSPNVAPIITNLFATINYAGLQQTEYTSDQLLNSPDGQEVTYYFVMTAFDASGNESGPSNEVSEKIDFLPPGVPIQFKVHVTAGK